MRILLAASSALLCSAAAAASFTAQDLVMLDRIGDPRLSPDQRYVAYPLRETDLAANKGVHGLWLVDLAQKPPVPRRLTAAGVESNAPRWSADGRLYFLSKRSGSQQVWRLDLAGGEAQPVTALPLDVGAFAVSPGGDALLLSLEVFSDCPDLACSRRRLDERSAAKARGRLYEQLFVRHWDTWKDGTRAQLFHAALGAAGAAVGEPRRLSAGIDGDVPTRPFGGDEEFAFTPDGRQVIFTARVAGRTEAWSTDTDLWLVPADGSAPPKNLTAGNAGSDTGPVIAPDGRMLAWRSQERGGFEADRYRIMLRDLATSATREVAPAWDRSADALAWSGDGRALYALAEELGQRRLFRIDLKSGKAVALTGDGHVGAFDAGAHVLVYRHDDLRSPAQLLRIPAGGGKAVALTRHNEARLAGVGLGDSEQFTFSGAGDETVHAYVMKPAAFTPGRKYPVAFIVHGGPQGSMGNHWHYRWNPQTWAGAGFAVVFIDFHGSTGYGQAFTDSITGDWGGRPLEDLQKGWAAALARYDFLDGSRACALGGSYGGYMVNWIAGNWPDAFRCLVNHDGIFDLRMMGYTTEELWFTEWEFGGTPFTRPENYERFNPVNHVARWRTPMLVIHGGLDYRVPDTQGIAAFTALQRRGIPSRLLHFPDENHWVLKPHSSLQWHEAVLGWLRRWTAGD